MWPNPQETADLVTFTEKILNGKPYFLCSEKSESLLIKLLLLAEESGLKSVKKRFCICISNVAKA